MNEKYLPVGTVVRLKDGQKNIMVTGFAASSKDAGDKVFDYMGVFHPEGVISTEMNFLFNHDQIEEILFEGFVNEEEKNFKNVLNEFLSKGTINGQVPNFDGMLNKMNDNKVEVSQPQMFSNNNQ